MQFLITAYDQEDDKVLERRMASREAHIATISKYRESGNMLIGAAILDDDGEMIGSSIVADFASEDDLHEWLENEPYVLNDVWGEVAIQRCSVGPSFLK